MADVDRLDTLAGDLLAAIETAATTHAVELPDRRFVAVGEVAWDCALVCVSLPTVNRGRPTAQSGDLNRAWDTYVATYEVWLLRDVPVPDDKGRLPTVEALNTSAAQLARDGYLLTVAMAQPLRTIEGTCTSVAQGVTQAVGPDGGLGGWQSTIAVAL